MNLEHLSNGAARKVVTFGDIAQNVAVRVEPGEAQTGVYVGLEHLDVASAEVGPSVGRDWAETCFQEG